MTIASMIIQPAQGYLAQVAAELSDITGVTVLTATPNQQIIIVIEASSPEDVCNIARCIETKTGVSGVYLTYINSEA